MSDALLKKVDEAVQYILDLDVTNMECGRYEVNEDFYYMIQEYETKYPNQARYEAHQKYVDIQYMVDGMERMEVADSGALEVDEPYNPAKDVEFYKDPKQWTTYIVEAGEYQIFYPKDSHKPGLCVEQPIKVKKIVGKVKI